MRAACITQTYSGKIAPFMPNEPPTFVAMKRIFSGGTFIISAALAREPMTPCVGAHSVKRPSFASNSATAARGSMALMTMRVSTMCSFVTWAAALNAASTFSLSPKW